MDNKSWEQNFFPIPQEVYSDVCVTYEFPIYRNILTKIPIIYEKKFQFDLCNDTASKSWHNIF